MKCQITRLETSRKSAAELLAAEVYHVHSGDTIDVVRTIDGSVGVYLTVNEHGLKLLP